MSKDTPLTGSTENKFRHDVMANLVNLRCLADELSTAVDEVIQSELVKGKSDETAYLNVLEQLVNENIDFCMSHMNTSSTKLESLVSKQKSPDRMI